jgi:hypothetical protein
MCSFSKEFEKESKFAKNIVSAVFCIVKPETAAAQRTGSKNNILYIQKQGIKLNTEELSLKNTGP